MFSGMLNFAFYSPIGGGAIGELLFRWEQAGVFSYVLPFLLIFALVFAILDKTKIFNNKGINAIIALAVGLMALQFNFVSIFFSEIFPRLGIGLSIILAFLIVLGLFINPKNKGWIYFLSAVAIIVVLVVVIQSLDLFSWYVGSGWGYWLGRNWATILGIIVFIGFLGAIIVGGKGTGTDNQKTPLVQALLAKNDSD